MIEDASFIVETGGIRLDAALLSQYPSSTRAFCRAACAEGEVTVNGRPVKKNARAAAGDIIDFALPASYHCGDNIRLWIRAKDLERLQANPDIEVRVYATDILNPDTQCWTHYVPQHPHGEGCFLAIGSLLTVLFLVMVVKKVCFNPSKKKFP